MERIATANTVTLSNGKTGYGDGTPGVTPPTQMDASPLNAIQEELAGLMEYAAITLQTSGTENYTQLQSAIRRWGDARAICACPSGPPSGASAQLNSLTCLGYGTYVIAVGASGTIRYQIGPPTGAWSTGTAAGGYSGTFNAVTNNASTTFVAVGTVHEIETSTSASAWTQRTPANSFAGTFYGACWSPSKSLFCIVGSGGEIQTSPDGTTWTHRTAAASFSGNFRCVCWSVDLALFCAVGDSGTIQTSPDGVTWTAQTAGSSYAGVFTAVAAGLVGGTTGFVARGATANIMQYSTNGTSWTQSATATIGAAATNQTSLVFCPSQWGGLWLESGPNNGNGTFSFDGITWKSTSFWPHGGGSLAIGVMTPWTNYVGSSILPTNTAQSVLVCASQNTSGVSDVIGGGA